MLKLLFWIPVILIAYTYVIYTIVLYVVQKSNAPKLPEGGAAISDWPFLTLIVCAYNEEKIIKAKILNTLNLDYPKDKIEIIFASDGSTDNTNSIITSYSRHNIRLITLHERSGKINVLNRVIPQASSEFIVLSDANTMFEPDALKQLMIGFSNPQVGCACGKLLLKKPLSSNGGELEGIYWQYENYLKSVEGQKGSLLGANGGIYVFRKSLFKPLLSNTICEDFVIPLNILAQGYKVIYADNAIGIEETSQTIEEEQARKTRIGAGAYQAFFHNLYMLNIFKGFPSFAYWSHKAIRWFVPFLLITVLISNILLISEKLYYYIAIVQAFFYIFAFLGYLLNKRTSIFRPFHLVYYFLSMNLALLIGFVRFLRGTQKVTWQRISR